MTPPPRVLAIDPSPPGFGYAVLEGDARLVDWGLAHVTGANKNAKSVGRCADLLRLYRPQVLAVEDCASQACRRRDRARVLIHEFTVVAQRLAVETTVVTWHQIRCALDVGPQANKEAIMARLARAFPELADRKPPHRRPWMSEDPRTSIFDAAGLAVVAALQYHPERLTRVLGSESAP